MAYEYCDVVWEMLESKVRNLIGSKVPFYKFRKIVESTLKDLPSSEVIWELDLCGYIDLSDNGYVKVVGKRDKVAVVG